jgi:hypothetical protein
MSGHISRGVFAILIVLIASGAAMAGPADPPVPPGMNSGGTPLALICKGIDYTRENIATILARDGEGEIIGYDFVDDDRRPYARSLTGNIQDVSDIVIGEGQAASMVAIRANPQDAISLAKAIGYAAKSPAKIIAIDSTSGVGIAAVIEAASKRFPDHLFVVESGYVVRDADSTNDARSVDLVNVIATTAANADGSYDEGRFDEPGFRVPDQVIWPYVGVADIAVATDFRSRDKNHSLEVPPGSIALMRTAALAARLLAAEPGLNGAAMKARILGLAKPLPGNPEKKTRAGWIVEPWRHFWRE